MASVWLAEQRPRDRPSDERVIYIAVTSRRYDGQAHVLPERRGTMPEPAFPAASDVALPVSSALATHRVEPAGSRREARSPATGERLQRTVSEVSHLLTRHRLLDAMASKQEGPRRDLVEQLQHRQNLVELNRRLRAMHPADVAYVISALSPDDRHAVWDQLAPEHAGEVLVEVPSVLRAVLIGETQSDALTAVLLTLDPEDLAFVAEDVPATILDAVSQTLASEDRTLFDAASGYEEASVGRYMTLEWLAVLDTATIGQALDSVRRRQELPPQTDRVFVVDARHVLRGVLPLISLILSSPEALVTSVMAEETTTFTPVDDISEAARAFERYDLVSVPVIDRRGKLVGRLTVDAVRTTRVAQPACTRSPAPGSAATRTCSREPGRAPATGGPGWR